jgi:hypothetical protein
VTGMVLPLQVEVRLVQQQAKAEQGKQDQHE